MVTIEAITAVVTIQTTIHNQEILIHNKIGTNLMIEISRIRTEGNLDLTETDINQIIKDTDNENI